MLTTEFLLSVYFDKMSEIYELSLTSLLFYLHLFSFWFPWPFRDINVSPITCEVFNWCSLWDTGA